MQLTYIATALFAAVALGAPAAEVEPSSTGAGVEVPAPTTTNQPVTFTVPHGKAVAVPQACCIICSWTGCKIGCGKKYCGK